VVKAAEDGSLDDFALLRRLDLPGNRTVPSEAEMCPGWVVVVAEILS